MYFFDDKSLRCAGANSLGQLCIGTAANKGNLDAHLGDDWLAIDLGL